MKPDGAPKEEVMAMGMPLKPLKTAIGSSVWHGVVHRYISIDFRGLNRVFGKKERAT